MKRIIVCCDGAWNADDTQTNDTNVAIVRLSTGRSKRTAHSRSRFTCGASVQRD
jgi:uncharacterized protein (DUF2235 family)